MNLFDDSQDEDEQAAENCLLSARCLVGNEVTTKKEVRLKKSGPGAPETVFLPGTKWTVAKVFAKKSGGKQGRFYRWLRLTSHGISVVTRESNIAFPPAQKKSRRR